MAGASLTVMQMNQMIPGVTSTNGFYEKRLSTIGRLWIIDGTSSIGNTCTNLDLNTAAHNSLLFIADALLQSFHLGLLHTIIMLSSRPRGSQTL